MPRRPSIHISDRAVLCYLERVAGVDVDRLRAGIFHKVHHAVNSGAKSITVDGFTYVIEGRAVVTVYPAEDAKKPAKAFRKWSKGGGDG